jgi:hypothetical protein
MSSQNKKAGDGAQSRPAVDPKAERLAAALRANLKRRKGQARVRAEREGNDTDEGAKTR